VPAGNLVGCDGQAASPGMREPSAVDEALNIITGKPEKSISFQLTFSKDSAGRPTLLVKSDGGPWMTDLAFTCCGTCPAGTMSQLEEVDLSDNAFNGPPPLSFDNLKASLRKLNLTYNSFAGDYTRLAAAKQSFLRGDLQFFDVLLQPQRPCASGTYEKSTAGALYDLPACKPIPVRRKRAMLRLTWP
jgi:hypothetical protein